MISVGTPTLKRYDLCVKLIESACNGSVKPDRFVVVDNGNALPNNFPTHVEVIRPGRNVGVGPAWNLLAKECLTGDGDKLLICGDDVEIFSDTLEKMAATMDSASADFVVPDPGRSSLSTMFSCFMVRQHLFDTVGYFDEDFWPAYFEDNDFHYRMRLVGAVEAVAPCGHRHVGSATLQAFSPHELSVHHGRFAAVRDYYVKKWGGLPGNERFKTPFGKDG